MLFLKSIHEDHGKDWLKHIARCLSTLLILICTSCPQVILLLLVEDDTLRTTAVVDYNNKFKKKKKIETGNSQVVQWLTLCSQCKGPGVDPWLGN